MRFRMARPWTTTPWVSALLALLCAALLVDGQGDASMSFDSFNVSVPADLYLIKESQISMNVSLSSRSYDQRNQNCPQCRGFFINSNFTGYTVAGDGRPCVKDAAGSFCYVYPNIFLTRPEKFDILITFPYTEALSSPRGSYSLDIRAFFTDQSVNVVINSNWVNQTIYIKGFPPEQFTFDTIEKLTSNTDVYGPIYGTMIPAVILFTLTIVFSSWFLFTGEKVGAYEQLRRS